MPRTAVKEIMEIAVVVRTCRRIARAGLCLVAIALAGGCASLPDFNRVQANMDAMVGHMGVMSSCMPAMVYNTQRMADNADRIQARADRMISTIQEKGSDTEKAVQNYMQAMVENDRAVVKSLRGIKEELNHIKGSLPSGRTSAMPTGPRQSADNADLEGRLVQLERRLDTLESVLQGRREPVPHSR